MQFDDLSETKTAYMKIIYTLITLCCLQYNASCQEQGGIFNKKKWSVDLEFGKTHAAFQEFRETSGSNFQVMGLDFFYLPYEIGKLNFTFNTGFNYGEKHYDDIYPNIEFEGGYMGSFIGFKKRVSLWTGFALGYKPFSFLEVKVPIGLTGRTLINSGEFYLYEGQEISESDLVSQSDAYTTNYKTIGSNIGVGFRTGAEIIFFPDFYVSLLGKVNYQTFGSKQIWDLQGGRLDTETGDMVFKTTPANNTSEWGIQVGFRVNIDGGRPKKPKRQGNSSSRRKTNTTTQTAPPKPPKEDEDVKLKPKTGRK